MLQQRRNSLTFLLERMLLRGAHYRLLFIAAIKNVPTSYYEAAALDGAGPWRQFFSITLPSIAPTSFIVILLNTIHGMKEYPLFASLNNGGPGTSTMSVAMTIFTGFKLAVAYSFIGVVGSARRWAVRGSAASEVAIGRGGQKRRRPLLDGAALANDATTPNDAAVADTGADTGTDSGSLDAGAWASASRRCTT